MILIVLLFSYVQGIFLSIVVTGRNDDYGGGFHTRMTLFFENLCRQIKHKDVEIVTVDWNSLGDIVFPDIGCPIRVIKVSRFEHEKIAIKHLEI